MKIKKLLLSLSMLFMLTSCMERVENGEVGIKFDLLGSDKGVTSETAKPGYHWIGVNTELYRFPTWTQNYVWTASETEGSENDESFRFQDVDGLTLSADIGITYTLDKNKVPELFSKYKRGINEITDIFLRNTVRDELVSESSILNVQDIYGKGKTALLDRVESNVNKILSPTGVMVDKLYWIGDIRIPQKVREAINRKIEATQKAEQRENELRETEAEANKVIARAEGERQSTIIIAEGKAASLLIEAEAEAKANRLINQSLTHTLNEYKKIETWDGKLPHVTGSNALINLK